MNHHTLETVLKDRKLFRKALTCYYEYFSDKHSIFVCTNQLHDDMYWILCKHNIGMKAPPSVCVSNVNKSAVNR